MTLAAPASAGLVRLVEQALQVPREDTVTAVARIISLHSKNKKTGAMVTIAGGQESCDPNCLFYGNGCYGENRMGRPSMFDMVRKALATITVRDIPRLAPKWSPGVRVNTVGDYLLPDGTPDYDFILDTNFVAKARKWFVISYTHAWRKLSPRMFDYVVRASTESAAGIEEAHAAGWYTVVADPGPTHPETLIGQTFMGPEGKALKVVQCPQQTRPEGFTCADCGLCARKAAVVAFATHGTQKKKATNAILALRGVPS